MEFRRKIYSRGGSFETTIPKPLLLALEDAKSHDAVFAFDAESGKWTISFKEREETSQQDSVPASPNSRGDTT